MYMPIHTGVYLWVCALRVPADTAESLCSAYTYDTYHMIFSANAFARGQEVEGGGSSAARPLPPLDSPIPFGFVSASGVQCVRTSLLLGAAIALSACA